MNSSYKKIESILLSEDDKILDKINKLLELDYTKVVKEVFQVLINSLFTMTEKEIDLILENIEIIVLNQNPDNFDIIINFVKNTNQKMTQIIGANPSPFLKKIKFNLVDLNRKMNEVRSSKEKVNLYLLYYKLIFEDKRLELIKSVLNSGRSILHFKDSDGKNLFSKIVVKYCNISKEDIKELEYYHNVIELFLGSDERKIIEGQKDEYLAILNNNSFSNKDNVRELTSRLEKKEDINFIKLADKYHVNYKIHDSIINEMKSFVYDNEGRIRTDGNFITIDEENAECLDDALTLIQNKDGSYTYYVAIADIPSFVPYKSLTFYDALKRVETHYLIDRVIDLYHPYISRNLCSLKPNTYRNVIVYKFLVDPRFNLDPDSLEILKAEIKVNSRLTYRDVNKEENIDLDTMKMIEKMYQIVSRLKSMNRGKEEYRRIENAIRTNATYHHSMFTDKSNSANIIQESMLLVNSSAPKYFADRNLIYIFRNHKIVKDKEANLAISRLLDSCKENMTEEEYKRVTDIIENIYLTAHYSTVNEGHEGLGYDFYSHSTCGARRFADSFNQYLTYLQVFDTITDKDYYELEIISKGITSYLNEKKKENTTFENEYNRIQSKVRKLEKK